MQRAVYDDLYFQVVAPKLPLNSRDDGGHLILVKEMPVNDRSDLTYQEAIDFVRITMIVGRAMYDVLGIERMNYYEDLGNWGLDEPGGAKMHLHFLVGRGSRFTRFASSTSSSIQKTTKSIRAIWRHSVTTTSRGSKSGSASL